MDKVEQLLSVVGSFEGRKRAQVREILSLIGKLNAAARVVRGGRTYLRRMLDTVRGLQNSWHVKLSIEFKQDLQWWSNFLRDWNGVEVVYTGKPLSVCSFQTDASSSWGAGAFYEGDWISQDWASTVEGLPKEINELEVFPILLSVRKWSSKWRGRVILVLSDNTTTVSDINKGSSKSPCVMVWLREIVLTSATAGFELRAVHLAGVHNRLADALSRGKWKEFERDAKVWKRARAGERGTLWAENQWLEEMQIAERKGLEEYERMRGLRG